MSSYVIEGGTKLKGTVKISGSKNASLPIIAATLLNNGKTTLYNVPDIHDTQITLEILKHLGCKVIHKNAKIIIDTKSVDKQDIPEKLMKQMRSSVIIAGALIGRFGKAKFSYPGGCDIGARPIDLHLKSFKKLGININEEYGFIECKCDRIVGNIIELDFPSVGATENIILSSVLAQGKTTIINAAREPEISDLIMMLNKMGAKITGINTNKIIIEGVRNLKNISYRIIPDRIEAGTFLCAAAITGSNIKLINIVPSHLKAVISKLKEMGCRLKIKKNEIEIFSPKRLKATQISTMPYPGFPTDMQSIFGVLFSVSKGTSIVVENIFENRFKYIDELIKMGADIKIIEKTVIINGVKKLNPTSVNSTDLRGGAALVLAGICTKGVTRINNIKYILRGYENLDKKLNLLGANIKIEEGD